MTHPVSLRAIVAAAALFGGMTVAQAQETIFYSTQLRPIEEATKVRDVLLKGVPGKVTYVVDEPPAFAVRMKAETQAGKRTASVVGALHGELQPHVPADLQPVDDVAAKLADRGIPASLMELGKLGTGQQQYIPWMQATYVMVANKQALQYLPAGADVNALTYAQLQQWGKTIADKTGQRRARLPGRPDGPDAALLPGLFLSVLHRRRGDDLQVRRCGSRLGRAEGSVGGVEPELHQLQLHAGAAARRRGVDRVGPHRAREGSARRRSPTSSSPSRRRPARRAAATCR